MSRALLPLLLPLPLLAAPALGQAPIEPRLKEHALFSRLKLEAAGETGPRLRLFLEAPRRPSATHAPRATELFAPWMLAVDETFQASYVTPNTLERREGVPELGVVLIANGPSFSNAQRYSTRQDHLTSRCLYVDDPGVIVGQWNERMSRVPGHVLREPILRRMVDELFDSYYRGSGERMAERWVVEGVAGYLTAGDEGTTPEDLANPPVHAGALERTLGHLQGEGTAALLLPLETLASSNADNMREQVVGSLARDAGLRTSREDAHQLFRDQAALWVHYLERGEGGRHVTSWRHYVAKALHDNGSPAELAATLGTTVADLDEGFRAHLALLSGGEGGAAAAGGPITVDEGPVLHAGLVQPATDADALVADALGRAALGDVDVALAYLEAGLRVLRGEDRGRVAAERDRLRAVRETRDTYLAGLAGDRKRRLRWTQGGESVSASVTAYADGTLTLARNKSGVTELHASALTAADLARTLGTKVSDHGPAWVGPYLLLLAGDARWDKKLDEGDADGAALAAAIELPALARDGAVRARLAVLARTQVPRRPAEVSALLAELGLLAAERQAAGARAGLEALATQVLDAQWAATGIEGRLKGKVESEGRDRVRITYEFDDPAELEDFLPLEGYLSDRTGLLPKLNDVEEPGWAIRGGNLEARGGVALRHLVGLQAPIQVDYQLLYGRAREGKAMNATILMAVCDDAAGGYVGAWDLFDLDALEPSSGFARTAYEEGERLILPARTIDVRLDHAGPKATLKVGGEVKREVACGRRKSGTTLLWVHADATLAVRKLVIRGTLVQGGDDPARRAWIAAELGKLGF